MSIKLKAILATTMLLTSFTGAVMPVNCAAASPAEIISKGKQIADANGIVLDSDADAAELAALNSLNGNSLPVILFNDDHTVYHIDGLVSGLKVHSVQDAKAVIASISNLLGIQDVDAELMSTDPENSTNQSLYSFQQLYQGIPIEGASITIFVNSKTGKVDYLNSTLIQSPSVDTALMMSAEGVRTIVMDTYGADLLAEPTLMIIHTQENTRRLVYLAVVNDLDIGGVYIDAQTGSILRSPSENYRSGETSVKAKYSKSTKNPVTGLTSFEVDISSYYDDNNVKQYALHWINDKPVANSSIENGGDIYFYNKANAGRKNDPIDVYADKKLLDILCVNPQDYKIASEVSEKGIENVSISVQRKYFKLQSNVNVQRLLNNADVEPSMYKSSNNQWKDEQIGAMYQMERVYDYFQKFSRDFYNYYKKAPNNVLYQDLFITDDGQCGNAGASSWFNRIEFGKENEKFKNAAAEPATLAHEYAHRLMQYQIKWNDWDKGGYLELNGCYGEAAAIDEGLADVFGQFAANSITGELDWIEGDETFKNGGYFRDATRNKYYVHSEYGKRYEHYYRLSEVKYQRGSSYMEGHAGATIVSHIAYLMEKSKIGSPYLWYDALTYMRSSDCSFLALRRAAAKAALDYNAGGIGQMKVYSAFNYAQIIPDKNDPDSYDTRYTPGDVNRDGKLNVNDAVKAACYIKKINYYTTDQAIIEEAARCDVNYDGEITDDDVQMIQKAYTKQITLT